MLSQQKTSLSRNEAPAVVILLLSLCFSHIHLGTLGVDAIRYAHISFLALKSGDWINLYDHFMGETYANKPPLLFWLTASSFHFLGVSTFSARLPSVLCAFLGYLLIWQTVRRLCGPAAGMLCVFLIFTCAATWKSALDLSFEGLLLLAAGLWFWSVAEIEQRHSISLSAASALGLAVFLFLQAKPPMLFIPLCAACAWLPCAARYLRRHDICLLAPVLIGFSLAGLSWLVFYDSQHLARTFSNQLSDRIVLEDNLLNLPRWASTIIGEYSPLVWLFLLTALRRPAAGASRSLRVFYLTWAACALPLMLFAQPVARYLLLPSLALAVLAAPAIAERLPERLLHRAARLMIPAAAVPALLALGFGISLHPKEGVISILQTDLTGLPQPLLVCSDGGSQAASRPRRKRMEMLLDFELNIRLPVYSSANLGLSAIQEGGGIVADKKCLKNLHAAGLVSSELLRRHGAALVTLARTPAPLKPAAGADLHPGEAYEHVS